MTTITDLTPLGATITGSLSSICAVSTCQPLIMVKNRLMAGMKLPPIGRVYYRGYPVTITCDQANQPLNFTINNLFSSLILKGKTPSTEDKIISGFLSGTAASILVTPCERVMILQQCGTDLSIKQVFSQIYKIEGARGFFKGYLPTTGREVVSATCFFGLQKDLKKMFSQYISDENHASRTAYFVSGLVAGFFTTPIDLIKTLAQRDLNSDPRYFKYVKSSFIKEHGKDYIPFLAKSFISRSVFLGCLLGALGTASTFIPQHLPQILHKGKEG